MATKKFFTVLLLATGILSIILSVYSFDSSIGTSVSRKEYGGDAYTGIQNAAAQTANNVHEMAEMISFSFGSILLVGGLALIFSSCNMLISYAQQGERKSEAQAKVDSERISKIERLRSQGLITEEEYQQAIKKEQ